ncbi:MAG: alpha/beta hydrolase [Bacteroidota bacterium]
MNRLAILLLTTTLLTACNTPTSQPMPDSTALTTDHSSGYAEVNGMKMYYEIHGTGEPLVLIHGGGSTIETSFGRIIPLLAKDHKVIAVELQAHGRTGDRNQDLSFEQDADDVAALLNTLNINKADFFGFSNGSTTTLQIAIRHPELVNRMVLGSALAKRNGVPGQFWDFMANACLDNMPQPLKDAYKQVAADSAGLQVMHDRDAKRMVNFKDIPDDQLKTIQVPALIIVGDKDVITVPHAEEMHRLMANSQLAVIPGAHGEYMGEITTVQDSTVIANTAKLITGFLDSKK